MTELARQLPFEIFPTDDEQILIETFSITCPSCKEKLDQNHLRGTIEHDTIKKAVIQLECFCPKCGAPIDRIYRMEVREGKMATYQKVSKSQWNKIELAPAQ